MRAQGVRSRWYEEVIVRKPGSAGFTFDTAEGDNAAQVSFDVD
jgi:hypothetical protein